MADPVIKIVKKKKEDTGDVIRQVITGIKGDWDKLLWALDSKKKKIARPGK